MPAEEPSDLLEKVIDRDSFITFVEALADERARAQDIEKAHPDIYVVDGALNWKKRRYFKFLICCA